ncbi:MAG: response regulator [Ferruginibacter sp.]
MNQHPKFILCVDDDSDDLFLLEEAIRAVDAKLQIVQLTNGAAALNYLSEAKEDKALPCVVVMDINMPVMNGRETVTRIKSDPTLAHVPVIVLTTSSAKSDVDYFKAMDVMMYTKPMNNRELKQVAEIFVEHCK